MIGAAPPLAPDVAIPARDVLLDPHAMASHLAGLLGLGRVDGAAVRRAKYRVGENLRVVYELATPVGPVIVAGRTFAPHALASAGRRSAAAGAEPVLDAAHGALWWRLPADRRLVGLADLLAPEAGAGDDLGLPRWRRSELVEYAPERSATLRALDADGAVLAYVKTYAPGSVDVAALAQRYVHVARALGGVDDVRAPRVLATDAARHRLVLEPMPGRDWGVLAPEELAPALVRLGRAIAHLHRVPVPSGAALGPFGRLASRRILGSAAVVGAARPDVGARVDALARALVATRPPDARPCLLHGDCHPKNALVADDAVALIDLDQAGVGAAAADVGSLLARLATGALVGEHAAADEPALAAAFLAGYGEVGEPPAPDVLRWHVAAALVAERAVRAVNRLKPSSLLHLDAIVGAAEDLLGMPADPSPEASP